MALSIVTEQDGAPLPAGITKTSRWFCDVYVGTAADLIGASLVSKAQFQPQPGRALGRTAFLPNGNPCPIRQKAWREPGFTMIRQQDDGRYSVSVTVAKDLQKWRREAEKVAEHEAEQVRINKEVAEEGHKFRNWQLRHTIDEYAECWEGTKAQLQAIGLGVGLRFPGEPGASDEDLHCNCPLGFAFRIYRPTYERAKAAAGIFTARSGYGSTERSKPQYVAHAPGVLREVWTPESWWSSTHRYSGTADALLAAGIVPAMKYFPRQPRANSVRASYRTDWSPATNANGQRLAATIQKQGKHRFSVEVPVSEQEEKRRRELRDERQNDEKERRYELADERRRAREGGGPEMSVKEFRDTSSDLARTALHLLRNGVFGRTTGGLRFVVPEDSELHERLTEAFEAIEEVIEGADVVRVKQRAVAPSQGLKLAAARKDKGLQSLLRTASHLRLVGRPQEDE